MKTSEATDLIAAALAKAQARFPTIAKDKVAKVKMRDDKGEYSYRYANLASVVESIKVPLSENGLAIIQGTHFEGGAIQLTTRLAHSSGQWIEGYWPVKHYERPQDQGSALTYARRYTISALLGIVTDEDDDGSAASRKKPVVTQAQISNLVGAAKIAGLEKPAFLDLMEKAVGHRVPANLTPADYEKVLQTVKEYKPAPAVQA